ncbi:MAG TPA: hypothetical protein VJB96_02480 [Patescibacteria group bacterium]|nr:hypothetical protein [Patescibacteria group bacterium]
MRYVLKIIELTLPITAIALIVLQVVLSNALTTQGKQVGELENEVRFAIDVKEALEIQVASASSLLTLRDRAFELGYGEPTAKQILNLTLEVPVAFGGLEHPSPRP